MRAFVIRRGENCWLNDFWSFGLAAGRQIPNRDGILTTARIPNKSILRVGVDKVHFLNERVIGGTNKLAKQHFPGRG